MTKDPWDAMGGCSSRVPDSLNTIDAEVAKQPAISKLEELGKECYYEAYAYELEYPPTKWSTLLFKVAKALGGDK